MTLVSSGFTYNQHSASEGPTTTSLLTWVFHVGLEDSPDLQESHRRLRLGCVLKWRLYLRLVFPRAVKARGAEEYGEDRQCRHATPEGDQPHAAPFDHLGDGVVLDGPPRHQVPD